MTRSRNPNHSSGGAAAGGTRGRSGSSTAWLRRQERDPYVLRARREGRRSRAAHKLEELNAKFGLLRKRCAVVDLGAAPGGWSQVALEAVGPRGAVLAVDVAKMDSLSGVEVIELDIEDSEAAATLRARIPRRADVVLADLCPKVTGHRATDAARGARLAEAGLAVAAAILRPGGHFVVKVVRGGAEGELMRQLRELFRTVVYDKPPASRKESAEWYAVAKGFRPVPANGPEPDGQPIQCRGEVA